MGKMLMKAMKEKLEALTKTQRKVNEYLTTNRDKQAVNVVINRIEKKPFKAFRRSNIFSVS